MDVFGVQFITSYGYSPKIYQFGTTQFEDSFRN